MHDETWDNGGAILPLVNWLAKDILNVLWFLLPGFVATWVFTGLTAYPKLSEFERVVEALIYTAFAQTSTYLVKLLLLAVGSHGLVLGEWNDDVGRAWSVILALFLGLAFAWLANHDVVHRLLRPWLTTLTGYPSEWFGVLKERVATHAVVLHLPGKRRLYGRVDEWPTDPKSGHFSIWDAEWLVLVGKPIPLGVARILVPATDVSFIEFIELKEATDGTSADAQAATAAATTTAETSTDATTGTNAGTARRSDGDSSTGARETSSSTPTTPSEK